MYLVYLSLISSVMTFFLSTTYLYVCLVFRMFSVRVENEECYDKLEIQDGAQSCLNTYMEEVARITNEFIGNTDNYKFFLNELCR